MKAKGMQNIDSKLICSKFQRFVYNFRPRKQENLDTDTERPFSYKRHIDIQ